MTRASGGAPTPPRALTIAGSDSGGGAGIQADLRTFAMHGCHGSSAITALTAQNALGVQGVHAVPPEFVALQVESVLSDIGADAAKTGMLAEAGIITAVVGALRRRPVPHLVVDPVMVAKGGHRLLAPEAVDALRAELLPMATLLTPNLEEAADLLGWRAEDVDGMVRAAQQLAALGPRAVLVKGGHLGPSTTHSSDVLFDGTSVVVLAGARLDARHTHGTGCTLSAAITARLARGEELQEAVRGAKAWLTESMRRAFPLGSGIGPVNHLWELGR